MNSFGWCFRPLAFLLMTIIALNVAPFSYGETNDDLSGENKQDSMTSDGLAQIVLKLDSDAEKLGNGWVFMVEEVKVTLVYDTGADRMRIVVPVTAADTLQTSDLVRLMQANFDSALDARYAIAQDTVWSTYIHPLSSLSEREFLEGVGQAVNLFLTFGTTYTSGALVFGGGDSEDILRRKLIDELIKKGIPI